VTILLPTVKEDIHLQALNRDGKDKHFKPRKETAVVLVVVNGHNIHATNIILYFDWLVGGRSLLTEIYILTYLLYMNYIKMNKLRKTFTKLFSVKVIYKA
jgi:hypothetical protein